MRYAPIRSPFASCTALCTMPARMCSPSKIGCKKRPDSRPGRRKIGKIGCIGGRLRRRRGLWRRPGDPGIGVGRLQDRLLLVPGPFAKHAVQPKADKERHERQDDDDSQIFAIQILQLLKRT